MGHVQIFTDDSVLRQNNILIQNQETIKEANRVQPHEGQKYAWWLFSWELNQCVFIYFEIVLIG